MSDISRLMQQVWPSNRATGDYRTAIREAADQEPRKVICGFCEAESPLLTGPEGRAWFKHHSCSVPKLRLVKS